MFPRLQLVLQLRLLTANLPPIVSSCCLPLGTPPTPVFQLGMAHPLGLTGEGRGVGCIPWGPWGGVLQQQQQQPKPISCRLHVEVGRSSSCWPGRTQLGLPSPGLHPMALAPPGQWPQSGADNRQLEAKTQLAVSKRLGEGNWAVLLSPEVGLAGQMCPA